MEEQGEEATVSLIGVKEEPMDINSQEVQPSQQQQVSPEDDQEQRNACTPESHSEARTFLAKCVFCSKTFTSDDNSKLLECLHAACTGCIASKVSEHNIYSDSDIVIESNMIVCQVCNVTTHTENLIDNKFHAKFLLLDDLEAGDTSDDTSAEDEEKKCTSCHDNASATSWCVDCKEFICENCVNAHQRLKITKDHTIKPKNEVTTQSTSESQKKNLKLLQLSSLFCSIHTHEQLSLFCQTCDQLTCRDCQLSEHRDHKYKFIHEIAAETRNSVSTLLKEVIYKRVLLKSAMKVIEDRQVLIFDKKKSLVQEITHMVVQLTKAISSRGKQLITRLNEVCDQKQSTLNEKKEALDQLSKLTDHCIQFVDYALEKGSDMELLYSKKSVVGHLQRIKNRRADIPNPEIPVRINLSLEKVPDLIKIISSIGAIVVDGRVYPSGSPSSGTSTPTTLDVEPKQVSVAGAEASGSQATTQATFPSVTLPYQQPTNPPQPQSQPQPQPQPQLPGLQSIQPAQQNYPPPYPAHTMPPRSSPQTLQPHQRIPYTMFNGSTMRPMIMPRSGPPNCHQQQQPQQQQQQQQIHMELSGQNSSLRGLLAHNPPPFRPTNHVTYRLPPGYRYPGGPGGNITIPRTAPPTYQPTNPALVSGGRVQQLTPGGTGVNSPISYPLYPQTARWHIPQGNTPAYYPRPAIHPQVPTPHDAYKIILKNQNNNNNNSNNNHHQNVNHNISNKNIGVNLNGQNQLLGHPSGLANTVSSSVPKTPSPVPEAQKNQMDTSQVDSSTDEGINLDAASATAVSMTKDDPNEDWCAVCMDGGDAVLCCDKCPKVFHLYCHIPSLKTFPDESETWQCMLCTNVLDCTEDPPEDKRSNTMSPKDLRIAQRIILELYCQYEQSLPFREVVSREITEYHQVIKKPIALDVIRDKLKSDNPNHYTELKQVLADVRLMFKNAYTFNPVESSVYQQARSLEEFFEKLLLKWAPNFAYDDPLLTPEEDEDLFPPHRKYRRIIND
ncbi:GSCOCG00005481001-RA-CDS [Cotesia congregata]|nr:GSCOCG00005481001-RA-CDS [Cotesia congregata]